MQKGRAWGLLRNHYEYNKTHVRPGSARCQRPKEGSALMETHLISLTLLAVLFGLAWHNQSARDFGYPQCSETNRNQEHLSKHSAFINPMLVLIWLSIGWIFLFTAPSAERSALR